MSPHFLHASQTEPCFFTKNLCPQKQRFFIPGFFFGKSFFFFSEHKNETMQFEFFFFSDMTQKSSFRLSETLAIAALLLSLGGLGLSGFLYSEYQKGSNLDPSAPPDENFQIKVEKAIEVFVAKKEEEARVRQEEANKPKKSDVQASVDDDPMLGDPNAPITIIEFSDYECPYCELHTTQVENQIIENYINTGKANLVFRDFPLDFHADAMPAAVAANCARTLGGDDASYFAFHDKLYANQQNLNEAAYKQYASEMGLDATQFADCLAQNDTSEIEKDLADGQAYGVTGTPAFFINGYFIAGAYPYETFTEVLDGNMN